MNTELTRPPNLPETEFIGELQEFASEALAPDDPRLEPRERMGRPTGPPAADPAPGGEPQVR